MKLSIRHDTTYSYADEVCTSIQFLRLTPRDTQRQRILEWHLELPRLVRSQLDPYGNILHVMTMDEPHGALVLTAYGEVEIHQSIAMEPDNQSPLPFCAPAASPRQTTPSAPSPSSNARDGAIVRP